MKRIIRKLLGLMVNGSPAPTPEPTFEPSEWKVTHCEGVVLLELPDQVLWMSKKIEN